MRFQSFVCCKKELSEMILPIGIDLIYTSKRSTIIFQLSRLPDAGDVPPPGQVGKNVG